jgi:hypothetical protein
MLSWSEVADGRWSFDADEERHLLLQVNKQLVEFQHHTLHVYAAGGVMDAEWPLGSATWVSSTVRDDLTDAGDEAVWAAMAELAAAGK